MNEHPSYQNPTIQEALCEIRFNTPDPDRFLFLLGAFAGRVAESFPKHEVHYDLMPLAQTPITPMPGQAQMVAVVKPPVQPRLVFRHGDRQIILQLVPDGLTVNAIAPYPGWDTFREDILNAWGAIREVFAPPSVYRLILRYIDRVPLGETTSVSGWISPSAFVAPVVADAQFPLTSQARAQIGGDPQDTLGLSLGYQAQPTDENRALIADFERTLNRSLSPDAGELGTQIDRMHEEIWDAFVAIKGPRWNDILEGHK